VEGDEMEFIFQDKHATGATMVMLTLHQIMTQIVFQIKRTILEVAHLLGVQKVENLIKVKELELMIMWFMR
jgi:hypothetical protein